jgi:DNA-directed RNA polymerase specialized sigma24 family protein
VRLRQWATERQLLRNGRTTAYRNRGWRERRLQEQDARITRCIDFERALSRLPITEQALLVAVYRDKLEQRDTAAILGCSVRKVSYLLPIARQHLADTLERLDLL